MKVFSSGTKTLITGWSDKRKEIKMMNLLKKNFALLLAAVFCLALMACGISDGNSDVTMKFNDGGSELLMVWFWQALCWYFGICAKNRNCVSFVSYC